MALFGAGGRSSTTWPASDPFPRRRNWKGKEETATAQNNNDNINDSLIVNCMKEAASVIAVLEHIDFSE